MPKKNNEVHNQTLLVFVALFSFVRGKSLQWKWLKVPSTFQFWLRLYCDICAGNCLQWFGVHLVQSINRWKKKVDWFESNFSPFYFWFGAILCFTIPILLRCGAIQFFFLFFFIFLPFSFYVYLQRVISSDWRLCSASYVLQMNDASRWASYLALQSTANGLKME